MIKLPLKEASWWFIPDVYIQNNRSIDWCNTFSFCWEQLHFLMQSLSQKDADIICYHMLSWFLQTDLFKNLVENKKYHDNIEFFLKSWCKKSKSPSKYLPK